MKTLLRFSPLARDAFVRLAQGGCEVVAEVRAERVGDINRRQEIQQPSWTEPTQAWNNKELTFDGLCDVITTATQKTY